MLGGHGGSQSSDNDNLLTLHPPEQRNRIIVRGSMVAPVGQNKGVKHLDHFIIDVPDIIRSYMIRHDLRHSIRQLVGIACDRRKNDRNCIHGYLLSTS